MASPTKNELEAMRITRRYNLAWWFLAFSVFTACFFWACWIYMKLNDDPPLLRIALSLVNLVIFLAGPAGMYYQSDRQHKRFIRDFSDRLGRLERFIDSGRSTSGLLPDGTDPAPGTSP